MSDQVELELRAWRVYRELRQIRFAEQHLSNVDTWSQVGWIWSAHEPVQAESPTRQSPVRSSKA